MIDLLYNVTDAEYYIEYVHHGFSADNTLYTVIQHDSEDHQFLEEYPTLLQ